MKKILISLLTLALVTIFAGSTQVSASSNQDFNFDDNKPELSQYNLKPVNFGSYSFEDDKLILNNERVYNTQEFEINHKYRLTLKNATGRLTVFNGIADIQAFDLTKPETVSYEFTLSKSNNEEKPGYSTIGIGSYGTASFSGYSIEKLN